ncbi:MAG: methyltransferase domain-containing protein [Opitutales bacterium]|nr:methyltransferase domain-containing protein [Opitutales bacterium]
MDLSSVRRAYKFYAPIYDLVFGRIVEEGRRRAVSAFPQNPGDRILEIGVGNGRALRYYEPHVEVTGIDVSPEMLKVARDRFFNARFPQVKALLQMDAQALEFPDNSFDGAVAMYVASVVPDPAAMIREMFRVCRPGAPLVVVNHFASRNGVARRVERGFAPFSRRLGFRPDFQLDDFVRTVGCEPRKITRVNVGGYWKLLEFSGWEKAGPVGNNGAGAPVADNGNGRPPSPDALNNGR